MEHANCGPGGIAANDNLVGTYYICFADPEAGDYHLGENGIPATPGFAGAKDSAHPYALRTSSGLLGLARVADWMEDAYDIRGEVDDGKYRRLRDGKADLGCYQCWYDVIGTKVFIR